ncbi:hypothetical protein IQ266_09940 [filamentous cyanobacterium LEGE 11480]|uniref:Uncharacterized protein n=1 Tax=Romeriopsis navalis LEGE 11480 TaxID=2777977 RepID=A0A928Z3I0_9CYAN|nr:glycosyl hydrolase [Romeriopsis navalis]MBE9030047.1 hypothetical protein [Romeriopsis navalis LEGE 11480]
MQPKWRRHIGLIYVVVVCLVISWSTIATATSTITIKLAHHPIGISTQYIGACEGNVNFDQADIEDLGINTYRLYGGMSRWEPTDDDGKYGWPTIAQIKQNPDLIPWEKWDTVMRQPTTGSDYANSGNPRELWQGSAAQIFKTLQQAKVRTVLNLRNIDPGNQPTWALQLNPLRTEADRNEWWEHVFATVYWLNVRNDYQIDDFEIHNEPDHRAQGWDGNQADYFELVRVTADAINHVYATYLPDRQVHIHAPKTIGGSRWPKATIAQVGKYFDTVNIHSYDRNISGYVRRVRRWMRRTAHAQSPLWIGEWGTYTKGYNDRDFSLNLIKNMMRMSTPGETYIDGSHLFSLYDWGRNGSFEGLINAQGERRLAYYAFRLGIRALQGGQAVLPATSSNDDVMTIVTQDKQHQLHVLLVNDRNTSRHLTIDVSAILQQGQGTVREFSDTAQDEIVTSLKIQHGKAKIKLPPHTSQLLILAGNERTTSSTASSTLMS